MLLNGEQRGVVFMNYEINKSEIISILFYQNASLTSEELKMKRGAEKFYEVSNAYEGINMLLFPGVENERTRLIDEFRNVAPALLDYIDELLGVYDNLYSAMCKYTYICNKNSLLHTWRYDRQQSLSVLANGENTSFFSTSIVRKTSDYFKKKKGLLILEIEASPYTLHLSVNDVLGERSKYPDEGGILFPPFSTIDLEELVMTEEELTYQDQDDNPPVGKFKVLISNNLKCLIQQRGEELLNKRKQELLSDIKDSSMLENAKKVWETYNSRQNPDSKSINKYIYWKGKLQAYVKIRQAEVYQEFFGGDEDRNEKRKELLFSCIETAGKDANEKREQYEKVLIKQNTTVAVVQGIAAFFIAVGILELDTGTFDLSDVLKILGIGFTVLSVTMYRIFNSISLSGKVRQRTLTYLRLDELQRDIRFTQDFDNKKLDSYIERYKQIIREDNQHCIDNTDQLIRLLDELGKNSPEEMASDIMQ